MTESRVRDDGKRNPTNPVGKIVGGELYLHVSALTSADPDITDLVRQAAATAGLVIGSDFNVVKIARNRAQVSLLRYPHFFEELFPALERSWQVTFSEMTVATREYSASRNPPILHRKELLLPLADPRREHYETVTQLLEEAGLYQSSHTIGHKLQWTSRLALFGLEVHDDAIASRLPPLLDGERPKVLRYRTAIRRFAPSAPFQVLSRAGLLNGSLSVLDYGCGYGDDVRTLVASGIDARGWDPHFSRNTPLEPADIVNLGFVLNVIEDPAERGEVLRRAFSLATELLVVSTLKANAAPAAARRYADGYLTKRQTFQKTYSQDELKAFIEGVLDTTCISGPPGIALVPKTSGMGQRLEHTRQDWVRLEPSDAWIARRAECNALRAIQEEYTETLWEHMLDLGRPPSQEELPSDLASKLADLFGSVERAVRFARRTQDHAEYEEVRRDRRSELLAEVASRLITGTRKMSTLPRDLQRDVRDFFGSFRSASAEARDSLHRAADPDELFLAFEAAAEMRLGVITPRQCFVFHSGNLSRLPAVLQVLLACARVLTGPRVRTDLTKIDPSQPKVTFTALDDFDGKCLPLGRLKTRVTIGKSNVNVAHLPLDRRTPVLVCKSLFMEPETLHYQDQCEAERLLQERLGLEPEQLWYPHGILSRGLAEEGLVAEGPILTTR